LADAVSGCSYINIRSSSQPLYYFSAILVHSQNELGRMEGRE